MHQFQQAAHTKYPTSLNTTMVYLITTISETLSVADITFSTIQNTPIGIIMVNVYAMYPQQDIPEI